MRVIAVANQKGGCGKTTTSINLSAGLALLSKKILLIDLDPQGHSTCGLGASQESSPLSIAELFHRNPSRRAKLFDMIGEVESSFYLIPGYGELAAIEEDSFLLENREKILRLGLELLVQEMPDLDYVILDCPPNLGLLTLNALHAADEIIIPVEPSFFSLHGLAKISETLNSLMENRDCKIRIHALLTIFDSRTCFSREVFEEVRKYFKNRLFKTIIHECVTLKEAASAGQSIFKHDRNSLGYQDYYNLAVEFLERQWEYKLPEGKFGWDQTVATYFGPRRVSGGILFQTMSKTARSVEIAGDFNRWIPEPLVRRDENGLWQKVLMMPPGDYRYKFIVDGEWQIDPFQPIQQMNSFGTLDSLVKVQ
ncbi:MAG: AAA family ATPase [Candidatus Omnitrophica bacterium]|nr:AAA family ATPase [Candidatus Omnitrophota bacterium]